MILGDLHDANGRIQLPGFYDKVKPVSNAQRAQWDALASTNARSSARSALSTPAGERGYSALERLWARPTADINGMWGGYTGAGSKTVIASEASAKVSFRLVPGQDPDEVFEQFKRFVAERLPPGATVTYESGTRTPGIEVNMESPWVRAAQTVLAEEYGKPAVLMGSGGSIPVVTSLRSVLGIDSLLMGFGLDDDQVHSPNEKFEQRCFHHGIRSHVRLLAKFAGAGEFRPPRAAAHPPGEAEDLLAVASRSTCAVLWRGRSTSNLPPASALPSPARPAPARACSCAWSPTSIPARARCSSTAWSAGRCRRPAWRRKVVYNAAEPGWWHERVATFPRRGTGVRPRDGAAPRAGTGAAGWRRWCSFPPASASAWR